MAEELQRNQPFNMIDSSQQTPLLFIRDDLASDSEAEAEKLLQVVEAQPQYIPARTPSIPKIMVWTKRWLPHLVCALFLFSLFDIWRAWRIRPSPWPPKFGSIARATFYHASKSNELVGSISAIQDSCTDDQLSTIELYQLKNLISPFDQDLADKLQQAVSATTKLREDLDQPALAVSVHLKSLENSLVYMAGLLSAIKRSETRNPKLEQTLRYHVDTYLSDEMRTVLGDLRSTLDEALHRCDIVADARQTAVGSLPALLQPLGLVEPWSILENLWESDPAVLERRRIIQTSFQVFQRIDTLRASIQECQQALQTYQTTPFIFEHVQNLPPLRYITNATVEHFIIRLHEVLPELSRITQEVLTKRLL